MYLCVAVVAFAIFQEVLASPLMHAVYFQNFGSNVKVGEVGGMCCVVSGREGGGSMC